MFTYEIVQEVETPRWRLFILAFWRHAGRPILPYYGCACCLVVRQVET
jgi:hypothetical protein